MASIATFARNFAKGKNGQHSNFRKEFRETRTYPKLHGIISIGRGAIPTGVSLSLLALDAILVTAPGAVLESMARGLLFVGAGAPDCLHLAGCPVRRRASASGAAGAAIRALRRHPQSSVGRLSRASRAAVASRVSQATG